MAYHVHKHTNFQDVDTNSPVCPMMDSRSWSYMSTRTTNRNYLKNFCQSVQKKRREGKGKEKKEKKLEWQLQSFLRLQSYLFSVQFDFAGENK